MAQAPQLFAPQPDAKPKVYELYIGDLHPDTTDTDLYQFFQAKDLNIVSIKIPSNHKVLPFAQKRDQSYAYVNFYNKIEAEKAIDSLNNTELLGRKIRIMWKVEKAALQHDSANLYIKNIDSQVTQQELHDAFLPFGSIKSCKLQTWPNGQSKGFGYIQFDNEQASAKAIEGMNDKDLKGKILTVCEFRKKGEREEGKVLYTNLYVKNIPATISESELTSVFAKYGTITSIKLESEKGIAFVCYETHDQAVKAETELNGVVLSGGKEAMIVTRHLNKFELLEESSKAKNQRVTDLTSQLSNCNLYIKPLPFDITEERVRKEFEKYGEVKSIKLENKNDRYFGYVMYVDSTQAQKAMIETNGQHIFGKPLQVEFYETPQVRNYNKEQEQKEKYEQDFKNLFRMMQGRQNYSRGGGGGQRGQRPRGGYSQRGVQQPRGGYQQRQQRPMNPRFASQPMMQPRYPQRPPVPHIDTEQIFSMDKEEQVNHLGEILYPHVEFYFPDQAPKITGMLLDQELGDVIQLLQNAEQLQIKIYEANQLLDQNMAN